MHIPLLLRFLPFRRQRFLITGQSYGFNVAEQSYGEGLAADFSQEELQHILQQQLLMAKLDRVKALNVSGVLYGLLCFLFPLHASYILDISDFLNTHIRRIPVLSIKLNLIYFNA